MPDVSVKLAQVCFLLTASGVKPDEFRFFLSFCRETDRDLVSSAASLFIVSSVKVPDQTNALVASEMNHQLPDQRINAIYRFQVCARLKFVESTLYRVVQIQNFLNCTQIGAVELAMKYRHV